ncbi:MAG: lysylphosphatidylglycerol synthase transmembrane domain-containing protein [Candidatus Micrarchaeia archaeon]
MKSIIIRVSVSLILLAIIIYKFNFKNIIYLNIFYFLPIIFLSFLMTMLRVLRWKILLKTVDYNLKFSSAVQIYLVGIFYGLMTPGKIGELGKAYFFSERLKVLEISIFEKILDIVILSFLSTIPLFIHLKLPESKELVSYVLVVVLILVTIFFAYLKVKKLQINLFVYS